MASSSSSAVRSTVSTDSLTVEPPLSPRSRLGIATTESGSSRHVLFSELPPKHRSRERFRPVILAALAWTFLALFAVVLVILLLGVLLALLLHSGLPEITVRGVRFALLDLSRRAEAEFTIEFDNRNDRTALAFGPLAVEASSGRFGLGRAVVGPFHQAPRNSTLVTAATSASTAEADEIDDVSAGPVVVVLKGHVAFRWGGICLKGVPVLIMCTAVVSEIDHGHNSPCSVRIIPV